MVTAQPKDPSQLTFAEKMMLNLAKLKSKTESMAEKSATSGGDDAAGANDLAIAPAMVQTEASLQAAAMNPRAGSMSACRTSEREPQPQPLPSVWNPW